MLKLSRSLLLSRNLTSEKISVGIVNDVRDGLYLHALTSEAGIATAGQSMAAKGNIGRRVFAPYSFFKGKAAMSVNPVLPTFIKTDSGDLRIHRKGNIMLTFWPSIGERKYDWSRRQKFALSATEVGSLINIGPKDSAEFFHDPSMLSSNAGQVRKSLSIKANADTSGYFVNLNVVNNILKTTDRFVVPVTAAEFAVMKTACSFALPHIMGWDQATNKIPGDSVQNVSKLEPQLFDSEWDR